MTEATKTQEEPKRGRGRPRRQKAAPVVDLPAVEASMLPVRAEAEQRLQVVSMAPCDSPERFQLYGGLLTQVRNQMDLLETQRTSITGPINTAKRNVDALFRPAREIYEKIEELIINRMREYRAAIGEQHTVAMAQVAAGSRDAAVLATAHEPPAAPDGLVEVEDLEIEVTNLAEVPREFMAVDEALCKAYARRCRAQGVPCEIAGVQVQWVKAWRRKPESGGQA